jgi:PPIC-type PPIASE domain
MISKRPVRLATILLAVCAAVPMMAAGAPAPAPGSAEMSGTLAPDAIVATVDGQIIILRSVLKEIGPALASQRDPRERVRLIDGVILQLVRSELQVREAKRLGLEVHPGELKKRLKYDEDRAQARGRTLASILSERGISIEEHKAALRKGLLTETYLRAALGRMSWASLAARPRDDSFVRPSEVQEYYRTHRDRFHRPEEVRLRWIFAKDVSFLVPGMEMAQAHRKAQIHVEGIRSRIEKGDDFESLAREFSEDQHREKGGDQGLKTRQDLPEFLRAWAFKEKPGTMSAVLETPRGYLIARIEERNPPRVLPFTDVQKQIKEMLRQERFRRGAARVLLELVEEAEIRPEYYKERLREDLSAVVASK